jgi:hypothetical protein
MYQKDSLKTYYSIKKMYKKMQNELTIQENSGSNHFFTVFSNKDYDEVSKK